MTGEKRSRKGQTTARVDKALADDMKKNTRGEFGRRLREIRTERGMTQVQIATALGITKNAITNWETGLGMPETGNIVPLCTYLQCTADDLFGMHSKEKLTQEESNHLKLYRAIGPYERHYVDVLMRAILEGKDQAFRADCKQKFSRVRRVPLLYSAGTGNPLDSSDGEAVYEYLRNTREVCMADAIVTVTGDSMFPTYRNGDDLLIQRAESIEPGEIGIFVVAGEGFVKEYQKDGLHSHNKDYSTIHPTEDDNARCVGRVLAVITDEMRATEKESQILDEIYAG